MLSAINEKQCSVQGYTPPANVQKAMRPFLDSIWVSWGRANEAREEREKE